MIYECQLFFPPFWKCLGIRPRHRNNRYGTRGCRQRDRWSVDGCPTFWRRHHRRMERRPERSLGRSSRVDRHQNANVGCLTRITQILPRLQRRVGSHCRETKHPFGRAWKRCRFRICSPAKTPKLHPGKSDNSSGVSTTFSIYSF